MSEGFRTAPPDPHWSGGNSHSFQQPQEPQKPGDDAGEDGRTLLIGILGGLVSAAGYMIYRRLPDEQKEALHNQVKSQVAQRINEIRANFNI